MNFVQIQDKNKTIAYPQFAVFAPKIHRKTPRGVFRKGDRVQFIGYYTMKTAAQGFAIYGGIDREVVGLMNVDDMVAITNPNTPVNPNPAPDSTPNATG